MPVGGVVNVTLGNVSKEVQLVNGCCSVVWDGVLSVGLWNVSVSYVDVDFGPVSGSASFNVLNNSLVMLVDVSDVFFGECPVVNVSCNMPVGGVVNITLNNVSKEVQLINGSASILWNETLSIGTYTLTANYKSDEDNITVNATLIVSLIKTNITINLSNSTIDYGDNITVFVIINETNITGNLSILLKDINNKTIETFNLTDNEISHTFTKLNASIYTIWAIYDGDILHEKVSKEKTFIVNKANTILNVNVDDIYYGQNAILTVYLDNNVTGTVNILINNNNLTITLMNGTGSILITDLDVGTHNITVQYNGDENYNAKLNNTKIVVSKVENYISDDTSHSVTVSIQKGKDVNAYYLEKAKYQIRLISNDYARLSNVKFTVDGKTIYAKPNNNGFTIITLPTLKPGEYVIKAEYNGQTVSNKITIKGIIDAKKVTNVKKSVKSAKIKITVKGNEPFKKVKITVNFNKKNYDLKTNNKGETTFNLKKSILKKLKKGKTYKYTIAYKKNTITRYIKIK